MVDAGEMLLGFIRQGMPDRDLFMASVGELLAKVRKASRSKAQGLTVFGEMVAVLWEKGAQEAALQLEDLWNDALNDRAFHLHCAYPRWGFINDSDQTAVCGTHSHIFIQ